MASERRAAAPRPASPDAPGRSKVTDAGRRWFVVDRLLDRVGGPEEGGEESVQSDGGVGDHGEAVGLATSTARSVERGRDPNRFAIADTLASAT